MLAAPMTLVAAALLVALAGVAVAWRRPQGRLIGAALVLASIATACGAGGTTADGRPVTTTAIARRSSSPTTDAAPPTPSPPQPTTSLPPATTTTTALPIPPAVVVDGDPGSGNLTAEPSPWLDVVADQSVVPNRVVATNRSAMPLDVGLTLTVAINISSDPLLPTRVVVAPFATATIATLGPLDPRGGWTYQYEFDWQFGAPGAAPSTDVYARPIPPGVPAPVVQGPGGAFSHNDRLSGHAYDFGVPIGTPVLAARAGIVATIDQGFTAAGTDPSFRDRGNAIQVLHDDGTWALYLHLDPRSSRVRIGDPVAPGQVLALSGNTGFSQGPHLHFAVMVNQDSQPLSIPITIVDP